MDPEVVQLYHAPSAPDATDVSSSPPVLSFNSPRTAHSFLAHYQQARLSSSSAASEVQAQPSFHWASASPSTPPRIRRDLPRNTYRPPNPVNNTSMDTGHPNGDADDTERGSVSADAARPSPASEVVNRMLRGPASPVAAQPQPPPLQSGTFHDRYVSTATGFRGLQRLMTELHVSQQQHQQLQQRASGLPRPQQRWMPQGESVTVHQQMRPQFRGKVVFRLECGDCGVVVCDRGMRAILLADTAVELFSTDHPPNGVQMVNEDYVTKNCYCRIRDVACLHCGNIVGYHVTQPCKDCLSSCNNGHFWMFHLNHVQSSERIDSSNGNRLFWARLPRVEKENETRLVGPGR